MIRSLVALVTSLYLGIGNGNAQQILPIQTSPNIDTILETLEPSENIQLKLEDELRDHILAESNPITTDTVSETTITPTEENRPATLELRVGYSSGRKSTLLDKDSCLITSNTLLTLLHFGLEYLKPEKGTKGSSIGMRTLLVLGTAYPTSVITTLNHELGHFLEADNLGFKMNLELSWNGLSGKTEGNGQEYYSLVEGKNAIPSSDPGTLPRSVEIYWDLQDRSKGRTTKDLMAISAAGTTMATELARFVVMRGIHEEREMEALSGVSYIITHSNFSNYLLKHVISGNYGITVFSMDDSVNTSDLAYYNLEVLRTRYFPYPPDSPRWNAANVSELEQFFDSEYARDDPYRPKGGKAKAIYAYHQLLKELDLASAGKQYKDPNLLGTMIIGYLDPYLVTSIYGLIDFVITGEDTIKLPPAYVPRLKGYLGVPRPMYGMEWFIPFAGGIINPAIRFALDSELEVAAGLDVVDVNLVSTPPLDWKVSIGGEVIGQEEGSIYVRDRQLGGVVRAGMKVLFWNSVGLGIDFSYKSQGVWSPRTTGLGEGYSISGSIVF